MAVETFNHNNPAFQVRKFGDPSTAIELAVRHPFIAWRFRHFIYKRNFAGAATLTLSKISGGVEVVLQALSMTGAQTSAFFDLDVEMAGGETIKVVSSGAAPSMAGHQHSVSVTWEERLDQVG